MSSDIDTLRATMTRFGFAEKRVDAALQALTQDPRTTGMPTEEEPLRSPKNLCEILQISVTTLWRHNPPYHLVGGRKRYLLSEVMAHLSANKKSQGGCRTEPFKYPTDPQEFPLNELNLRLAQYGLKLRTRRLDDHKTEVAELVEVVHGQI